MKGVAILVCPPHDTTCALELLFAPLPESERQAIVASLRESFQRDPTSRQGLFIASDDSGICGAVLAQEYPGRTAVLWPAHVLRGGAAVQRSLMEAGDAHLAEQGIVMAQALLPIRDEPSATLSGTSASRT
jgi:hypothetical protein